MIIKFEVDIKTLRKCFAIADMEIPTDQEIEAKMSDFVMNLSKYNDADMKQAELGFALVAIGHAFADDTPKVERKSKLQQRIEDMQKAKQQNP